MPIAHCLICDSSIKIADNLIEVWSSESGIVADHMTVNVTSVSRQFGNPYKVMCTLYLPTAWNKQSAESLHIGLSRSLAKCCDVKLAEVHVIALNVQPGMVVENGVLVTW